MCNLPDGALNDPSAPWNEKPDDNKYCIKCGDVIEDGELCSGCEEWEEFAKVGAMRAVLLACTIN